MFDPHPRRAVTSCADVGSNLPRSARPLGFDGCPSLMRLRSLSALARWADKLPQGRCTGRLEQGDVPSSSRGRRFRVRSS